MTFMKETGDHESVATSQPTLVFVGNGLTFSDSALRMAEADLSHVTVVRVKDLAELVSGDQVDPTYVVAVIVEQCEAAVLSQHAKLVATHFPAAMLAMAFRDPDVPARFGRSPLDHCVSLLPMRLQMDAWLSILRLLVSGEGYLPSTVLSSSPVDAAPPEPPQLKTNNGLTRREAEVLALVSEGHQNKIIAEMLTLSQHTVKLHLHHIIAKLGVKNRTEATIWYLSNSAGQASGE